MNIKDVTGITGSKNVTSSKSDANPESRPDSKDSGPSAETSDRLTLTTVGKALAKSADESAPVDRQRVEEIRSALADGSYKIDSQKLAQNILRLDRQLV